MEYDVVICGAGPAGLSTGISTLLVNQDAKVLILENREEVGEEKCAEGVSESWFLKMSDYGSFLRTKLKEKCFENDMYGMVLYLPNGEKIRIKVKGKQGWVLNKDYFLKNLAEIFESMGGEIKTGVSASRPIVKDGKLEGIGTSDGKNIMGKYFVDATGVSQNIWKKVLNITEPLDQKEIEVCFQYKVIGCNIDDHDLIHLYFTNELAPGGYAWVFPKGPDKANVGLGCQGSRVKSAFPFMQKFWKKLKMDGQVISKKGGTVSTFDIPDSIVWSNLACVGASARFTNPIHGGGTGPALYGGYILGKHIASDIKNNVPADKTMKNYQDEVKSTMEKGHKNLYRIKTMFQSFNDEEMNIALSSITEEEWTRIMNLTKQDMVKIIARITKKDMKFGLKIPKYLKL